MPSRKRRAGSHNKKARHRIRNNQYKTLVDHFKSILRQDETAHRSQSTETSTPHPIYVLSSLEYNKVRSNSVILSGFERKQKEGIPHGVAQWATVEEVGCHVIKEWLNMSRKNSFNIENIKGKRLLILCRKSEIEQQEGIIFVSNAVDPQPSHNMRKTEDNCSSSAYAVLLIVSTNKGMPSGNQWTPELKDNLSYTKPNTIKQGYKHYHFGQQGAAYGFGSGAKYSSKGMMSIAEYSTSEY